MRSSGGFLLKMDVTVTSLKELLRPKEYVDILLIIEFRKSTEKKEYKVLCYIKGQN